MAIDKTKPIDEPVTKGFMADYLRISTTTLSSWIDDLGEDEKNILSKLKYRKGYLIPPKAANYLIELFG